MRTPSSTYRLQLHAQLGFAGAASTVAYLDRLGITDAYVSPVLEAAPGSTHGYDVVDHSRIAPELGGESALIELATQLRDRGMGLLVDVVPNHMSITSGRNGWWNDVLENGPSSPYARYFDIDWNPPKSELKAKVLLPILGDQFGRVLERRELQLRYEGERFVVACGGTELPVAPRTWPHVLEPMLRDLRHELGDADSAVLELESILTSLAHLPRRTETDRARVRERMREKEIAKQRFARLFDNPAAARALGRAVAEINGVDGDPSSVDRLEALLSDQGYRPSFWRVASDEINYRRFFDINELAAIRIEEPAVFRAVHAVPLRLVGLGLVTGLRIDHVDGLLAPRQYLTDLRQVLDLATSTPANPRPDAGCSIVVEKILDLGERLPPGWPVDGTTGYEIAAWLTRVMVTVAGLAAIEETYQAFTNNRASLPDVVYESKVLVLETAMSAELTVLARKLDDISEQHRTSRDFTLNSLQAALLQLIACFPVYRTYIDVHDVSISESDRSHIEAAVTEAKRRNPATSGSIFEFVRGLLLLEHPAGLDEIQLAARRDFVLRFQQLTSPVMAKGYEDTAQYRHVPLLALNDVGSHPSAATVDELHGHLARRAVESPRAMSTTATHDTKRGEDIRARLCVLSELPSEWHQALVRLALLTRAHRTSHRAPAANDEYLLLQTLLGAWPPGMQAPDTEFVARIQAYMIKALREAKLHTSWIDPNEAYERDIAQFIATVLDPIGGAEFLAELAALRVKIERPGFFNALSQVVLKIGIPGVPDFYQGTELWDLSLVDPDNRRPVDFPRRAQMLDELCQAAELDTPGLIDRLRTSLEDGRIKMLVTARCLAVRRVRRELFVRGAYRPVTATGTARDQVIAFERSHEGARVIVACGRHFTALAAAPDDPVGRCWGDTTIMVGDGRVRDAVTGRSLTAGRDGTLALTEVFAHLPVAMLEVQP